MSTIPKNRTELEIAVLRKLSINTKKGEVIGPSGKLIGNPDKNGHIRFIIASLGKRIEYKRSHVIWWACHGTWPIRPIKHIDGDVTNDVIDNLTLGS